MIVTALALIVATGVAIPAEPEDYLLDRVPGSYSAPLLVTHPPGDERIFIVEQGGRVKVVKGGRAQSTPFIDVSGLITSPRASEQGLLGMAFHPSYTSNGRFFLAYTDSAGDLVISEFHASPGSDTADSGMVRRIITVAQPYTNHNGGNIVFGRDGYLYAGLGDGGGSGDPDGNGQNPNTLLGSIIRIDTDADAFPADPGRNYAVPADNPFVGSSGADEIWLWGLRNPWRFWFDPDTGLTYVGDVGQNHREEVTVLAPGSEGSNLGWNRLEGTRCYPSGGTCSTAGTVLPQVEYTHAEGQSITGGPVYRGRDFPELKGTYFYADFVDGWIRSFRFDGTVNDHWDWSAVLTEPSLISSFGTDQDGEVYITGLGGSVWRLEGRSNHQVIGDFDGGTDREVAMLRGGYWLVAPDQAPSGGGFEVWNGAGIGRGWTSHLAGDFDGDGRDDIANFHPSNGTWWVMRSTGSSFTTTRWADYGTGSGWKTQVVGDFNGDGRDDIAQFHPSNGTWWISRSTGSGFSTTLWADFSTASGWEATMVGDFNGDGRDDIAQFHPSNGTWWVTRSTGAGFSTELWADFTTASGWEARLVGDFNGDGRDDTGQFHPSNGTWWISRSTGTKFSTGLWADFSTTSGWEHRSVGDFNGDGRDDIAQFHASTGNWWISRSTGSGFSTTNWTP